MIIKLFQPPARNWLLSAEQLDDPRTWDRFVPCHTTDSKRWQFDHAVKELAVTNGVLLKPCKDLLTRGVSVFEYDYNAEEDQILEHALQVCETLELDLIVGSSPEPTHSAA